MFRAEDPVNFTMRVIDAVERRHHAEKSIKFSIYCDSMPLLGLPEFPQEWMEHVFKSVTRNGVLKGVDDICKKVSNFRGNFI